MLADRHDWQVGVGARHIGHDRAIDRAQTFEAEHLAVRVDDRARIVRRAHPAGADEVPGVAGRVH